ncbi:MAG: 2-dehydro-3-deoxyglucarate aldolase [Pirellulales bacterium]|nr:2-dehydro-3-deoxyglucarate aldolase [Pirellulales bacterium]
MKSNPVKKKLREGKTSFGTWLSLGDLLASRVLARLGFDWLTLDMEHQPLDWREAATVFGAIADAGGVPLARVPEGNHFLIKRALDAGAWGIVAPMVNTVEQANQIIAAAKYPPLGNRSLGGSLHGLNFDASPIDYFTRANDEILVVLQTESPQGIENAEAIYSLPGVDAIFVGPVDLRANMRKPDGVEATDSEFEAAIQRIVDIGKKTGTPTGMHVMSPDAARHRAAQGMQFLAVASDIRMMTTKAQEFVKSLIPEAAIKDITRY